MFRFIKGAFNFGEALFAVFLAKLMPSIYKVDWDNTYFRVRWFGKQKVWGSKLAYRRAHPL